MSRLCRAFVSLRCTLLHWPWWGHGPWEMRPDTRWRWRYCTVCKQTWRQTQVR